jgi:hypothetical protein
MSLFWWQKIVHCKDGSDLIDPFLCHRTFGSLLHLGSQCCFWSIVGAFWQEPCPLILYFGLLHIFRQLTSSIGKVKLLVKVSISCVCSHGCSELNEGSGVIHTPVSLSVVSSQAGIPSEMWSCWWDRHCCVREQGPSGRSPMARKLCWCWVPVSKAAWIFPQQNRSSHTLVTGFQVETCAIWQFSQWWTTATMVAPHISLSDASVGVSPLYILPMVKLLTCAFLKNWNLSILD